MDSLESLIDRLRPYPELRSQLSLSQIYKFIVYTARLRNDISLTHHAKHDPSTAPPHLSPVMQGFLSKVLNLAPELVRDCWQVLKDIVWNEEYVCELLRDPEEGFRSYGLPLGLASRVFYPPSLHCLNADCRNPTPLKDCEQQSVVFFTLAHGTLPAYHVHLKCKKCHTSYHHNYSVHKGQRHYYKGVPDVLQVGEHQFVETRVIELWIALMGTSWTSAYGCVQAHNSLCETSPFPTPYGEWPFSFTLRREHIWDAFTLLCLLEDCARRTTRLEVPHTGEQKNRFLKAVQERNLRMRISGQPDAMHRCNKCTRYYDLENHIGKVSCVVVDGVTIGHPCCAVHNCKVPLANQRHRFCPDHASLNDICSVRDCTRPVVSGTRACEDPSHAAIWQRHTDRGQSRFTLRARLLRARMANAEHALGAAGDLEDLAELDTEEVEFEIKPSGEVVAEEKSPEICPDKPDAGNRRIRAQFGRKRTHNEQVIVAPCGVIIARATFFGAEALKTVAEFIKDTFQYSPNKPEHIFFDSNCILRKVVQGDPWWEDIQLTVDVFHLGSKHSKNDHYCQDYCNPSAYPELLSDDGGWYFNSSIAEQTNVWLAGFNAICREMQADRYNFFLDELIMRRNRRVIEKLQDAGEIPGTWLGAL